MAAQSLGDWDRSLWGTYAGLYEEFESRRADIERLWAEERSTAMTTTRTEMAIEHVPIGDLRPNPANPRRISDAELESLTRSIREFGLVDPIIARHDDRIVGKG
jgi:hypothetical protein